MVVARVTEELYRDSALNHRLHVSCQPGDRAIVDALILHYLKYYGVSGDYSFSIVYPVAQQSKGLLQSILPSSDTVACYTESLEQQASLHSWMLQLDIREPEKQVWESLAGPVFISSLLVCIVLFVFFQSLKAWRRESSLLLQTRDFMNNMAHEFRTPITNISLAAKLLKRDTGDQEKYLQMIQDENNRLSGQVDTILSMYAMENGRVDVKKENADLKDIAAAAAQRYALQAEQMGGSVKVVSGDDVYSIRGDRQLLEMAVGNLIDNAIKYAGQMPVVTLNIRKNGNSVELEVQDNGPGIPPAYHEKVFERYFRLSNPDVHDTKGFGLGLSLVKQVVQLHEGAIVVKSDKGKGTTFILRFRYAC